MAGIKQFVDELVDRMLAQKPGFQMSPKELAADNKRQFDMATGFVGGVAKKLTPAEMKFWNTMQPGDWVEIKQFAPSTRLSEGRLHVDPKDVQGLGNYLDDVLRLREGERLPPSIYNGSFIKSFIP